jgi:protein SMG6
MELDGLALNATALQSAKAAIEFVASHIRSYSDTLKAKMSRGNYLSSLSVRAEQVDFDDPDPRERRMDDLEGGDMAGCRPVTLTPTTGTPI